MYRENTLNKETFVFRSFSRRSDRKWLHQQQQEVVGREAIENRNPLVQVGCSVLLNGCFGKDFCTIEGVLFSVPRFHRYIKKSTPKSRVTMGAAVYTAAVVCSRCSFFIRRLMGVLQLRLNI